MIRLLDRVTAARWHRFRVAGGPRLAGLLFDVLTDQLAHHLGRRGVPLRAQALEQRLLARIDEDGQAGGAILESQAGILGRERYM